MLKNAVWQLVLEVFNLNLEQFQIIHQNILVY